jgi:hypothetical protein
MSFELRFPNITAQDEKGQLVQMKSFLHQLVEQLQWALNDLSSTASGYVVAASAPKSQASEPTKVDANATFNAVKSLIIKSADIVSAYYDKIQARLDGIYVAESEFGAFAEQTTQNILSNSSYTERSFSNIQEITNSLSDSLRDTKEDVDGKLASISGLIDGISHTLIDVSANIRSGLLFYDDNGVPVYGLEVGQKTKIDGVEVFDKFARFTSDRLSFYDQNDNEVAYISDRKLYINHVEIKGTLKMGGFVKTVLADGSIVKRWITGGEG